jgi:hypothetical protein
MALTLIHKIHSSITYVQLWFNIAIKLNNFTGIIVLLGSLAFCAFIAIKLNNNTNIIMSSRLNKYTFN